MTWPGKQPYLQWTDASGTTYQLTFRGGGNIVISEDWDEGADITEHPVEVGANVADHVRVRLPKVALRIFLTNEPLADGGPDNDQPNRSPMTLNVPLVSLAPLPPQTLNAQEWQNMILERVIAMTAGGAIGSAVGGSTGGAIGALGASLLGGLLFAGHEQDQSIQYTAGLGQVTQTTAQVQALVDQWPGKDYVEATHALFVQLKNSAQLIEVHGAKQTEFNMIIEELAFHRDMETGTGEAVAVGLKQVRFVSTKTVALPIANLSGGGGISPVSHGQQELADASIADTPAVVAMHVQTIAEQISTAPLPVGFAIPGLVFPQ